MNNFRFDGEEMFWLKFGNTALRHYGVCEAPKP